MRPLFIPNCLFSVMAVLCCCQNRCDAETHLSKDVEKGMAAKKHKKGKSRLKALANCCTICLEAFGAGGGENCEELLSPIKQADNNNAEINYIERPPTPRPESFRRNSAQAAYRWVDF